MISKNYILPLAGKRLLVAPLDWGLGHATRCVPVIRELLKINCEVWLAGEGAQEKLLREEFPHLPFLPLKGYRIKYGRHHLSRRLLLQVPSVLKTIKEENNWLNEMMRQHGFEAVISDNRYGLHHEKIFSVFITHQLAIKSPLGKWSEKVLQQLNYRFINRFSECWIPDEEGENNLAGDLAHPVKLPRIPVKYIGALSRLEIKPVDSIKDHLLVILSGPEPQRMILENIIIDEVVYYHGTATIVRGLPGERTIIPSTNSIHFYNHLAAADLNDEMMMADFIISRSGYSTVMDASCLKKKCILIPTPGQTEQEYLAGYLMKKKMAFCVPQQSFSLLRCIEEAEKLSYRF
jgi:uncharacterized protein (TIGR00661 family)